MLSPILWCLYGALVSAFAAFAVTHYRRVTLRVATPIFVLGWLALFGALAATGHPLATAGWRPLAAAYAAFGLFLCWFVPGYAARGLGNPQGTVRTVVFPFRAAALTFDDGPSPEWTPKILEVLARHQVKATFFMVGEAVEKYPDIVREVAKGGHTIGSHSHTHRSMPLLDNSFVAQEIDRAAEAFERVLGRKPQYFRPPWGFYNKPVLDALRERGYLTVLWSRTTQDWRNPGADVIHKLGTDCAQMGDILLLHDGGNYPGEGNTSRAQTVEGVDMIIRTLEANGFQLKTLDDMVQAWLS